MTVEEFIAIAPWKRARTMPTIPHEYIVKGTGDLSEEDFEAFAQQIQDAGRDGYWNKTRRKYLAVDGWIYWTMSKPSVATIINRQTIEDADKQPQFRWSQQAALEAK